MCVFLLDFPLASVDACVSSFLSMCELDEFRSQVTFSCKDDNDESTTIWALPEFENHLWQIRCREAYSKSPPCHPNIIPHDTEIKIQKSSIPNFITRIFRLCIHTSICVCICEGGGDDVNASLTRLDEMIFDDMGPTCETLPSFQVMLM